MSDVSLNTNQQQPARNWWRMSLRTFLLGITLFCVVLGYWSYRAECQRQAVEVITRKDCEIEYSEFKISLYGKNPDSTLNYVISCLNSVIELLPEHYRTTVVKIELPPVFPDFASNVNIEPQEWEAICQLQCLEFLVVDSDFVTDERLAELKQLPNLSTLSVDSRKLTDAGLKSLREFKNLKRLFVRSHKISNQAIEEFKKTVTYESDIRNYRWHRGTLPSRPDELLEFPL